MLITVLIQLLLVGLLVLFCLIVKNKPQKAYLTEQFVTVEPVLSDLPKTAIKNTHWYTHTFMRPRRKG